MSFNWNTLSYPNETYECDEIMLRNFEECARLAKEQDEAMKRRLNAESIALGFSSWEERENHQIQRSVEIQVSFEKRLAESGMTVEDYCRDHPQRGTPTSRYALPMAPRARCDCLEHPIPIFCPRSLIDHRSMDELDFLEAQEHRQRELIEEIKIEPDDISKRLSREILERCWVMESQERSLELAPWFKNDETLQLIIDASSRSKTESLDSFNLRTPNPLSAESDGDVDKFKDDTMIACITPTSGLPRDILHPRVFNGQEFEIDPEVRPALLSNRISRTLRTRARGRPQQKLKAIDALKLRQTRVSRAREKYLSKKARDQELKKPLRSLPKKCEVIVSSSSTK